MPDVSQQPGKPKVLLLGKLPPPYMGPSVATQILLSSSLKDRVVLHHVNTNVHETMDTLGTWNTDKVWANLNIYRQFVRSIRATSPDIVVVPISQTTLGFVKDSIFLIASRLFRIPVLVQLRGSNLQNWLASAPSPVRWYVTKVLRSSHGAIVLGERLRYLFHGLVPEDRIFVVPNGANYLLPESRNGRASRPPHVNVLCLTNLQEAKGIYDVIEGVHLALRHGTKNFHLDMVGAWDNPETERRCKGYVAKHRLPVTFHPPAVGDEKFRLLAGADVFIFTPRQPEGHPWVIVEALAAGLPIISTDRGAIADCVLDGHNGFIVDGAHPEQIEQKLSLLVSDVKLRDRFGRASRQLYLEKFTEEKMVERMHHAICKVLNGHLQG